MWFTRPVCGVLSVCVLGWFGLQEEESHDKDLPCYHGNREGTVFPVTCCKGQRYLTMSQSLQNIINSRSQSEDQTIDYNILQYGMYTIQPNLTFLRYCEGRRWRGMCVWSGRYLLVLCAVSVLRDEISLTRDHSWRSDSLTSPQTPLKCVVHLASPPQHYCTPSCVSHHTPCL